MRNNDNNVHEELPSTHDDPLIQFLHKTIKITVKFLAILMVLVIIWGTIDLCIDLFQN